MKKAIIFDIDGVLAEKSPDRTFIEYNKVDLDKPIQQGFDLLRFYYEQTNIKSGCSNSILNKILFISGRKELCREKTLLFLETELNTTYHSLYLNSTLPKNWELFMRGDSDHRPAEILKKEIYDNHIKNKYDIVAVFEDDKDVCRMWKEQGLFVFQVGTRDDFCI